MNKMPKPLAIYYFGSNNSSKVDQLLNETSSGTDLMLGSLVVNESIFQVLTDLPFGGVGDSGYGKYHGQAGFDACSHLKAVHNKMALNMYPISCRYPPYTPSKYKTLKFLMTYGMVN